MFSNEAEIPTIFMMTSNGENTFGLHGLYTLFQRCQVYYRTPTGVFGHESCIDDFLYRPKLVNNSYCGCELFTFTDAL